MSIGKANSKIAKKDEEDEEAKESGKGKSNANGSEINLVKHESVNSNL